MTDAWRTLRELPKPTLAALFDGGSDRVEQLSVRFEMEENGLLFDWSKTHLDAAHIAAFEALAAAVDFDGARLRLLTGEIVNPTENRAAEHTAQRGIG
ncbi:MAG: glucose-6-phosphate isomerase, partial [Burkholderiales bacterium]